MSMLTSPKGESKVPNVSLAAIAIAYEVAYNKPHPDTMPFAESAELLQKDGHYTLLLACNTPAVIEKYPNIDEAITHIHYGLLKNYRIHANNYKDELVWLRVKKTGEFAKFQGCYNGYVIIGGSPPNKPGNQGLVWLRGGNEVYASVAGLEWK
jgi:hypothetical protein